ncbi:hypothetical protein O181_106748 [Austropuccinia psidii MF-1]|uniref:Uncharacterized protein n=1 Tax=Austropuccinia psidii MF-1 TaxID=1389203 RepID=A0A9Q3PM88_9BASI|nr:hypothetical protein [Austropuccinia psidii MF-1]
MTKGWNTNRKLKIPKKGEARIRENKATFQAIEKSLNQKDNTPISSGSQGVNQTDSPFGFKPLKHQKISSQESPLFTITGSSRRRKESKCKNKTSLNKMHKESDPMIQKPLDLVKEVHKSKK